MIVIDASAIAEIITDARGLAGAVRDSLDGDADWVVPGHTVTEAANALRGIALGAHADADVLAGWFDALSHLEFDERSVSALLPRILALSPNANAYDAAYIALAESLGVALVTTDRKLDAVPGTTAAVIVAHRTEDQA